MKKVYITPMTSVVGQLLNDLPMTSEGMDQNRAQAPGYRGNFDDTEEEEDW